MNNNNLKLLLKLISKIIISKSKDQKFTDLLLETKLYIYTKL
jgi:hypothetical protein